VGEASRKQKSIEKRTRVNGTSNTHALQLAQAPNRKSLLAPTRKHRIASATPHLQERRALDFDALSAVELELSHVELSGLGHGTLVVWRSRPATALPHADVAVDKRGVTGC
jgi:hypothetical protein